MIRASVFVLLTLVSGCSAANRPRDIQIVAQGMTFTVPSDPETANPVIRMQAGERVRVVLRNDAPGLMHNFEIPTWDVKSDQIRGGETTSVTFTVPETTGRIQYLCAPHSTLMSGFVDVSAR